MGERLGFLLVWSYYVDNGLQIRVISAHISISEVTDFSSIFVIQVY